MSDAPQAVALVALFICIALVVIIGPSKPVSRFLTTDNHKAEASLTQAETALAAHWASLVSALIALDAQVGEDRTDGFGRREALLERIEVASREFARVRAVLRGEVKEQDWVEVGRGVFAGKDK